MNKVNLLEGLTNPLCINVRDIGETYSLDYRHKCDDV